jgi:hypothetical protein
MKIAFSYQIEDEVGHTTDAAIEAEVTRISAKDLKGYRKFLKDSEARYWFGYEDLGRRSMHKLWDTIKVIPKFAMMRADRSVYGHAASRVRDERLRFALSFHPLFIGGDPFNVTSMYILVSHLEKAFGVHYAMGGVQAIAEAMAQVVADLVPGYGADCPVAVVWRASWPEQRVVQATLATIEGAVAGSMERTALILVGPALAGEGFEESSLYAADYDRRFRPQSAESVYADSKE